VRAGFQPVAADRFGDDDLKWIAPATRIADYPNGLLAWLRQLEPKPAGWMYTGGLENHPQLVDAMAAICPLWGNHGAVLHEVRSPWRLAEVLGAAGLPFPEIRRSPDGLPRDGSWLVKTGRGAGGTGVNSLTEEYSSEADLVPFFQRRVAGEPASAVFVAADRTATLLGVVQQLVGQDWLGAGEFQYCGAIGPMVCGVTVFSEIERVGQVLAAHFGLNGLFGVDLVVEGDRVWTIEVNPRYPASTEIVERTICVDAIAAHHGACTGQRLIPRTAIVANRDKDGECHGKAILFAKQRVTVSAEFANWQNRVSRSTDWPSIADLSPAGTIVEVGQPIMSVFATDVARDEIENQFRDRLAMIERSLYA
jgi:predicted ATP-grasp superfamily ATP-dependent carboligase